MKQIKQFISNLIHKCQIWGSQLIKLLLIFGVLIYFFTPDALAEVNNGSFPNRWINGTDCTTEPKIQVHSYNENLYILRQSLCTNPEAPFIYLIFGKDKVLMQDTGAGDIPIADTVGEIIDKWVGQHNKHTVELIVTHSHSHGDHVAGDEQFRNRPNTTVVGLTVNEIKDFFGIQNWPTQTVKFDLGGGRVIDVIPIPGHKEDHIALYDQQTGILFTGDSLYPGRLYFKPSDYSKYLTSIERLDRFTGNKNISWVLGTHIEMTSTPKKDFPFDSATHPNEHRLELQKSHLIELHNALKSMQDNVHKEILNDFIIYPT
jgi:hydroxyacylglutathione hydrolase